MNYKYYKDISGDLWKINRKSQEMFLRSNTYTWVIWHHTDVDREFDYINDICPLEELTEAEITLELL